ncbi:MAG: metallophosphatase [Candidatus Aminicenantes bacterium]|nr:metallophosphatase [Candidatus Aminicenantes bacterium]
MKRRAVWASAAVLVLLGAAAAAEIPCVFSGVARVVAVGDLHGDHKNFVSILKSTGIVDEDLRWAAGVTHFVQTGDIMDRGPDARKIFDLLMRLEKEATAAGGRVHVLIGNHEMMNISGIAFDYPDYVTVEQLLSFLPPDYIQSKEKEFLRRRKFESAAGSGGDGSGIPDGERRTLWAEVMQNDPGARRRYLSFFRDKYGPWLLGLNAVLKINETVFVHGGISPEYSLKPLAAINNEVRRELRMVVKNGDFEPRTLYARDGPLWYRDLAQRDEALFEDEVDAILANLQARHIVIAHTVLGLATAKNMKRFGGKVWIIDTGISDYYQGQLSALIIEGTDIKVWGVNDE